MKRLIYVSNNAISSNGFQNPFFLQEKQWLLKKFGSFNVVCPKGIYVYDNAGEMQCAKATTRWDTFCAIVMGLLDPVLYRELIHMLRDRAFSLRTLARLLRFSANGARMQRLLKTFDLKKDPEDVILYSFWMSFDAYAVAKIKKANPQIFAMCRAHSYEIQLEKNNSNPYLMKQYICNYLDRIAFISYDSLKSFQSYFHKCGDNICVYYLGSTCEDTGIVPRKKDNALTILSCSYIIPVKQLDWIIQALENWKDCPVHWIHMGDGPDREKIYSLANEKLSKNPLVSFEFTGYLDNKQARTKMRDSKIDVFVNSSSVEGIPVSIMEAMSVGLSVVAPRICGIPELVKENCGLLFELSDGPQGLQRKLEIFAQLTEEERAELRTNAFLQWEKEFCLENNLKNIFHNCANGAKETN